MEFTDWINIRGNKYKLHKDTGASQQLVQYWAKKGVPPAWVKKVSEATGFKPEQIRPDIF